MKIKIFISIIFTFPFYLFGQNDLSKALNNKIIRKYYSAEEIFKIYHETPEKFKNIYLYYTSSFMLDIVNNEFTETTLTDSIIDNFDISLYEFNRKENERFERFYDKLGFKLTLLSKNEFQNLVNQYSINDVNIDLPNGYPTNFTSTTYQFDKENWINNNQEAYQDYLQKCSKKVNLIPLTEFNNLPEDKKNNILSQPEKYIIY